MKRPDRLPMARKRGKPKPAIDAQRSVPFPDDSSEELAEVMDEAFALMSSIKTRWVVLIRSVLAADPERFDDGVVNTPRMEPPETERDFEPASGGLFILCHCRLEATRGAPTGRRRVKVADAVPILTPGPRSNSNTRSIPPSSPRSTPGFWTSSTPDAGLLDVLDAGARVWPYWREFVRDAFPVIDVPFRTEL